MNQLCRVFTFASMALAAALGCSSSTAVNDPDSETHWIHVCTVDSDCDHGLSCLCNTCTRACGTLGCTGVSASAECVTPDPSTMADACQLAAGVALCSTSCSKDADCSAAGSGLRCIGGACLAGRPRAAASRATSPSTWVADLLDAYCTWGIRCGSYPDGSACHEIPAARYDTEGFNSASAAVRAVSKGTAEFHEAEATACLNALSELDCRVDFVWPQTIPEPCAAAFSSHLADGGTCINDVECAAGSACVFASTATCQGTCSPAPGGTCRRNADCQSGEFCDGPSWQGPGFWQFGTCTAVVPPGAKAGDLCGTPVKCEQGLYCSDAPAPARCGTGARAGERCADGVGPGCAPGLACTASEDGKSHTCMPEAKLGDPCTALFQCGAQYLFSNLICDVTGSHTCVRRPSTGACVFMEGVNTCDPITSRCDGSAGSGTCTLLLPPGSPCVLPADGPDPCEPQASCQGTGAAARCVSPFTPACTPQ